MQKEKYQSNLVTRALLSRLKAHCQDFRQLYLRGLSVTGEYPTHYMVENAIGRDFSSAFMGYDTNMHSYEYNYKNVRAQTNSA